MIVKLFIWSCIVKGERNYLIFLLYTYLKLKATGSTSNTIKYWFLEHFVTFIIYISALYTATRKATGFKSVRVNCWVINQNKISKSKWMFWINLQKRSTTKKRNITIEFCIFEIVLVPNLSLNFWTRLTQKGNGNHHRILHIRISLSSKFQLQQTILTFWNEFHIKRIPLVKNRKNEHHHCYTEFQLKKTIFIILHKFSQKGYFQSKTWNKHDHRVLCIRIRLGIKFHFEQMVLNFGPNLPKRVFSVKKEQRKPLTLSFCG